MLCCNWRSYLQEKLEGVLPLPVIVTLIGLLWSIWHINFFLMGSAKDDFNMILPLLAIFMFNIYSTFIYHNTRSVLLVIVFHAFINDSRRMTPFKALFIGSVPLYVSLGVFIVIGYGMIIFYTVKVKKQPIFRKVKDESAIID